VSGFLGWLGATIVILLVLALARWGLGWLVAFVAAWFVLFLIGLLADEDTNHWDWPEDREGPATIVTLRIAGVTMLMAGVPCGLGWWFFSR